MQEIHSHLTQNIMQDRIISGGARISPIASKPIDLANHLGIPETDVVWLAEEGRLGAIKLLSGNWLFPPLDKINIWGENGTVNSSVKGETRTQLIDSVTSKLTSSKPLPLSQDSAKSGDLVNSSQSISEDKLSALPKRPHAIGKLNLPEVCDQVIIAELISAKKTRSSIPICYENLTGLKLEYSAKKRRLVVKAKTKKRNDRCCLMEWTTKETVKFEDLEVCIANYVAVFEKLKRRPTTEEFKLHSKKLFTVGDVLLNHLHSNVAYTHGEGSDEWDTIERLIRLHLSKDIKIKISNKVQPETVNIMNEPYCRFTVKRYNAYLSEFKDHVGVHDKILSRIKAAFNYAVAERMLNAEDARPFTLARRIGRERHVEVSETDMKSMFTHLADHENQDFIFFMHLQSSGHFRGGQVMSLRFSDFDLANSYVRVKPKRGKEVAIQLPTDLTKMVIERQNQFKARQLSSDYIFPSARSKTGHMANFDTHWNDMLSELGLYTISNNGEITNKYRLHDFRETLLGRLWECDEYTLASALGHLSIHAIKAYRKANVERAKDAAEKGHQRKVISS